MFHELRGYAVMLYFFYPRYKGQHKGTSAAGLEKGLTSLSSKQMGWQLRKKNQILLLLYRTWTWDIAGPTCHQGSGTTATTKMLHRKGKEKHFPLLLSICLLFNDYVATFNGSITKSLIKRDQSTDQAKVRDSIILTIFLSLLKESAGDSPEI